MHLYMLYSVLEIRLTVFRNQSSPACTALALREVLRTGDVIAVLAELVLGIEVEAVAASPAIAPAVPVLVGRLEVRSQQQSQSELGSQASCSQLIMRNIEREIDLQATRKSGCFVATRPFSAFGRRA